MKYQTVIQPVKRLIPVGYWLVTFDAIWDIDEETGREWIAEVEGDAVKVTADRLDTDGMSLETNTSDQYDDTHDFRPRLFRTAREAREHLAYTLNRFKNPQPWESFVKL